MEVIVGLVVLFFGGGYLVRSVSAARSQAWAGPRSRGMRQRAGSRAVAASQRPVRHEMRLMRLAAQLEDWRKGQDHHRAMAAKNGGAAVPGGKPPTRGGPVRSAVTAVKRLGTFTPGNANGSGGHGPGGSTRPASSAASPPGGNGHAPPPPAPRTSPNGSPGRTSTVSTSGTGGVEQLVEGYSQIYASAASGGIHAKLHAIKACAEGDVRGGQMASMLSRAMSEPGSNYGPEVTEPIAKASQHLQAAAMAWGEADAALTSLLNMSVGELAQSARQAPNHAELSENGSR